MAVLLYLHHGSPEMHRLRPNGAVEEFGEGALLDGGGIGGALVSSLGEAHLILEVGAEGLAEAEAETRGHLDR